MQQGTREQWFETVYGDYADAIFRFCLAKTSSRDVALDLSQEVFTRLWDQLALDKAIDNPRAFLYTVARNLVIDHYRRKKHDSLEVLADAGVEFGKEASAADESSYREALAHLEKLEEPYREAVYLRYVEELPPRDIAEITGESVNVISVRITRGMKQLRNSLRT